MTDVHFPDVGDSEHMWGEWLNAQGSSLHINIDEFFTDTAEADEWADRLHEVFASQSQFQRITKLQITALEHEDLNGNSLFRLLWVLREQLRELELFVSADVLWQHVDDVASMPNLTQLHLFGTDCSGPRAEKFATLLRRCPSLKQLDMTHTILCDADVDDLLDSFPFSTLECFRVTEFEFSDLAGIARLLQGCYHIRECRFAVDVIYDLRDIDCVLQALSDKAELTELDIDIPLNDELLRGDAWGKLVLLKMLRVCFAGSDRGFERLCSNLLHLTNLTALAVKCDAKWTSNQDRMLAEFLCTAKNISTLSFRGTISTVSHHIVAHIASSDCALKILYFPENYDVIEALKTNTSLLALCLDWSPHMVQCSVASLKEALQQNYTLRILDFSGSISGNIWSPDDLSALSNAMLCGMIETLCIRNRWHEEIREPQPADLFEQVANSGYLLQIDGILCSESCKQRMEFNKKLHRAARLLVITMVWARRFRKSVLSLFDVNVVRMIAQALYATRCSDDWADAYDETQQKRTKKIFA